MQTFCDIFVGVISTTFFVSIMQDFHATLRSEDNLAFLTVNM